MSHLSRLAAAAALALLPSAARAEFVTVTVTIQNLAPANGVSFAPLRLGFHNGSFDSFNNGQVATAPIISIAEGGSGSDWFPAFAAAEPNATLGSVGGALTPGATASNSFLVNTATNPFFTFGTMVIPSNDLFLGNDNPQQYRLFDDSGNLILSEINQFGRQIWDNGSEAADPANAAFLPTGVNSQRTPQNGVVSFDFGELAVFDGLLTNGGYNYDNSLLTADANIYRIRFDVEPVAAVPAPPTVVLGAVGAGLLGLVRRVRRRA